MHIRAAIVGLLMVLFFAPGAQAMAASVGHDRSVVAHDIGAQVGHVHAGTKGDGCLPHTRGHSSSCCEIACAGCPVVPPLGLLLPTAVEPSRPSAWHDEVMERLMPGGLDRPPRMV